MKPIEQVQEGDKAWAFNVKTGEWELKRVFATHSHIHEGTIVKVTVGDDVIESTHLHPYFVVSGEDLEARTAAELPEAEQGMTARGRWVSACDLRVGDVLQARGKTVVVDAVESYEAAVEVFNFGVEGLENYSVGEAGILVHNNSERQTGDYGHLDAARKRQARSDGFQNHHLNQDAAYGRPPTIPGNTGRVIEYNDGATATLRGSTFVEGGEHNVVHRVLEGFWNEARATFRATNIAPTNAEYGRAVERALREAGLSPSEIYRLSSSARRNRISHGHLDDHPVPNIPNPFPESFLPGGPI